MNNDDDQEWPSLDSTTHTPYIEDQAKFRKVVANVQFIKNAVEQHYLNEVNLKHSANNTNNRLSFKQAVLTRPKPPQPQVQAAPKPTAQNSVEKTKSSEPINEETAKKKKKKRSRSRSKKRRDKSVPSENESNRNNDDKKSQGKDEDFDLGREDFPDLGSSISEKKSTTTRTTSGEETGQFESLNKNIIVYLIRFF